MKTETKKSKWMGIVAIGLAVILSGGAFALSAKALGWFDKHPKEPAATLEALTFEETAYGTYSVSLKDYEATEIVVPSKFSGKAVTEIGGSELSGMMLVQQFLQGTPTQESVKTVLDQVAATGGLEKLSGLNENGFACATKLEKVTLPNSIKKIGSSAFMGCYALKEINIPDSVVEIGHFAWMGAFGLREITFPESVKRIGSNVCFAAFGLEKVTLSKNIEHLTGSAFQYCTSLTKIEIPAGVKEIQGVAFANCTSLAEIILPETLEGIEADAFQNCTALKTVYNLSKLEIVAGADTYGGVAKNATNVYTELPAKE